MPFYIRKSITAGPFRFNLSSGGVGVSVGVKGLRIGTGPRGHYVTAGRGGVYYRASLPGAAVREASQPASRRPLLPATGEPNVDMIPVSSASVLDMTDERYDDLLAELNAKQNATSMALVFGLIAALVAVIAAILTGFTGACIGAAIAISLVYVGNRLDAHRLSAVVMYDLGSDAAMAYESLTKAFDHLASSARKWHIDAGGAVRDLHTWKRNAGASTILARHPTTFGYALPRALKSNVTPPFMKVGKEMLYWLPDVLLVVENGKIGAVAYDKLDIRSQDSRFIEEDGVPADAQVVGQTWKHPNKKGGPDRRFSNNRLLPICLYEAIHLRSPNGLNELLHVSSNGRAAGLADAAQRLAKTLGVRPVALPAL